MVPCSWQSDLEVYEGRKGPDQVRTEVWILIKKNAGIWVLGSHEAVEVIQKKHLEMLVQGVKQKAWDGTLVRRMRKTELTRIWEIPLVRRQLKWALEPELRLQREAGMSPQKTEKLERGQISKCTVCMCVTSAPGWDNGATGSNQPEATSFQSGMSILASLCGVWGCLFVSFCFWNKYVAAWSLEDQSWFLFLFLNFLTHSQLKM